MSDFQKWLKTFPKILFSNFVRASDVYSAWEEWRFTQELRPMGMRAVAIAMREAYPDMRVVRLQGPSGRLSYYQTRDRLPFIEKPR